MTITAKTIIEAVDAGFEVHWANDGYVVEHWPINDEYVIRCTHNDHSIGLTWADGVTLNGKPEDFYAYVSTDQLNRFTDHRGMTTTTCPQCRMMILLLEEGERHVCTLEDWRDA